MANEMRGIGLWREMGLVVVALAILVVPACGSSKGSGDAGTDGDADADTDGDTDSETGTETDSDTLLPEVECGEDGDCQAPLICNELWGLCVVADCGDEDDFVPCEAVTDPDRAYDICIRGVCQSPGCGTVDCNPPGPHFPLGDSNQRRCAGGGTENWEGCFIIEECPAPGSDYYGQDAQFGWDTLHDHSERFTRTVPVPEEPIVEDNVTGLIWQGCVNKHRGADCEIEVENDDYQWKQRMAYCDSLAWGGYHDWRLPDRWELESLVDETEGYCNRNCDVAAFPDCSSDLDWTISKSAEDDSEYGSAFIVALYDGAIWYDEIYDGAFARCVRGVPNPRPRARWERDTSVEHQPVVHDHWTGLTWQGCPKGLYDDDCESGEPETVTWIAALDYCSFLAGLSWGGRDDWRVPSRHELSTIVDDRFIHPSLDPDAFPVTAMEYIGSAAWTSTSVFDTSQNEAMSARVVSLYRGEISDGHSTVKSMDFEVRCVAGGQD